MPSIEFEGATHEFPDDFSQADIAAALKKYSARPPAAPAAPAAPVESAPSPQVATDEFGHPTGVVPFGGSQQARELGPDVKMGSAPIDVRFKAGFGPATLEDYQRLLGPTFETQQRGPHMLYRQSQAGGTEDAGPFTTIKDPTTMVDIPDLASAVGDVLPTVGGVAGGAGGATLGAGAGSIPAAAAGAGMFGTIGEAIKLKIGQANGGVDPNLTPADLAVMAFKRGGIEALGAGAGMVIYKAILGLGRIGTEFLRKADGTLMAAQEFDALFNRAVSKGVDPNALRPSQIVGQEGGDAATAGRIADMERQIMAGRSTPQIQSQLVDKMKAAEREGEGALAAALPEPAPTMTREQLGARAGGAAEAEAAPPVDLARREMAEAQVGQEREAAAALTPTRNPAEVGGKASEAMEAGHAAALKKARAAYEPVDQALAGQAVDAANFRAAVAGVKDRTALNKIAALRRRESDIAESAEEGAKGPITYEELNATLEEVRRVIRNAGRGVGGEAGMDVNALREIQRGLEADRLALANKIDPSGTLGKQVRAADLGYKEFSDLYKRSFAAKVLSETPGGKAVVSDEVIVNRILANGETADAVAMSFRDAGPVGETARDLVRDAIRFAAQKEAGLLRGEGVNAGALQQWVETHRTSLNKFFTAGEIDRMKNVAYLTRSLEQRQKALELAKKDAEGFVKGLKVDSNDLTGFFGSVWNANNPQLTRRVMRILEARDPDAAKAFKGMAAEELRLALKSGEKDAIEKTFANAERMENMVELFGPAIRNRLNALAERLSILFPEAVGTKFGNPTAGAEAMQKFALNVTTGPLNRTTTRLKGIFGLANTQLKRRIARAVVDPKAFHDLLRRIADTNERRALVAGGSALEADVEFSQ